MKKLFLLSMSILFLTTTLFAEFQEGIIPDKAQEKTISSTVSIDTPIDTISEPKISSEYSKYFLSVYFLVVILTIFLGVGENRSIVVFTDYDDLGLTFLIPASFVLIMLLASYFGVEQKISLVSATIVSAILTLILLKNTYIANHGSIFKTILAFITKLPLAIIWIINLLSLLNPGGKTAKERRQNRGSALVLLTLLTPIVMLLVADKSGSYFNPKSWLKGRRVGSLRKHL